MNPLLQKPVADSASKSLSPLKFVRPPQTKGDNDYALVTVDSKKLDAEWAKDKGFYVGPQGTGDAIGGRYQRFIEWRRDNPDTPVEAPIVSWNEYTNSVSFTNGRHRFSVLRDQGYPKVQVLVPKSQLKIFHKLATTQKTAKTISPVYHGTPHVFDEFEHTTGTREVWGIIPITVKSNAFFFTPDKATAVNWAANRAQANQSQYVLECTITLNNPVDFRTDDWVWEEIEAQPLPMEGVPKEHETRTVLEALRAYTEGKMNEIDWHDCGIDIDKLEILDSGAMWKLIDMPPVMDTLRFLKYDGAIVNEGNDPEFGGISYAVFNKNQIKIVKRTKTAATNSFFETDGFLYHGTTRGDLKSILKDGKVDGISFWGVKDMAEMYSGNAMLRVPFDRFNEAFLLPDENMINDPYFVEDENGDYDPKRMNALNRAWKASKKTWKDSLRLWGAVMYDEDLPVTQADVLGSAKTAAEDTTQFMEGGCGAFAVALCRLKPGSSVKVLTDSEGERWSDEIPYEASHAYCSSSDGNYDVNGRGSTEEMAADLDITDFDVVGPWLPDEFAAEMMGSGDKFPMFGDEEDIEEAKRLILRSPEKYGIKPVKTAAADQGDIQNIVTEMMSVLAPGLPHPKIRIINQTKRHLGTDEWLWGRKGGQTWGDDNTTISVQKSVLGHEETLRRIIAHELCHHEIALIVAKPKLMELGYETYKQYGNIFGPSGHGKEWREVAARFNAKYGKDFVSETSDQNMVIDEQGKEIFVLINQHAYGYNKKRLGWQWAVRLSPKAKEYLNSLDFTSGEFKLVKTTDHMFTRGRAQIKQYSGWNLSRTPEQEEAVQKLWAEAPQAKIAAVDEPDHQADYNRVREERVKLYAKFIELADQQRGAPEEAMLKIQHDPLGAGVYGYAVEHTGDLTHRMNERVSIIWGTFGYDSVKNKAEKVLRSFEQGYGFEREMQGNLKNNYEYHANGELKGVSFEEAVANFKKKCQAYANAHGALKVYNRPQELARDAAVALGKWQFATATEKLRALLAMIEAGPEAWVAEASQGVSEPKTAKSGPHKNASTQINLPADAAAKVVEASNRVADEDLGADGREDEPHITIKYGVKDDVDLLSQVVAAQQPFNVSLGKTHVFEAGEISAGQSPIVVEAHAPELKALHDAVNKAMSTRKDDFNYNPHATLAYVKPATAKKYNGLDWAEGISFPVNGITLSTKAGERIFVPFGEPKTASHKTPPMSDTQYEPSGEYGQGQETNAYADIPERVKGEEDLPSLEELSPDLFKLGYADQSKNLPMRGQKGIGGQDFPVLEEEEVFPEKMAASFGTGAGTQLTPDENEIVAELGDLGISGNSRALPELEKVPLFPEDKEGEDKIAKGKKRGEVYLLHFNVSPDEVIPSSREDAYTKKFHARHYLGFAEGVGGAQRRIEQHYQATSGVKLIDAIHAKGITFTVARIWEKKDRNFERQLKNQGGLSRHCPICKKLGIDRDSLYRKQVPAMSEGIQTVEKETQVAPAEPEHGPDFVEQEKVIPKTAYPSAKIAQEADEAVSHVFYIEVPPDARDAFWREPPEGKLEFWAFKGRPSVLPNETVYFTFDKVPVGETTVYKLEPPGQSACGETGDFLKYWKLLWLPSAFKKYASMIL